MAAIYLDEDFPITTAIVLRQLGHDVLTARDAGEANLSYGDERVLDYARQTGRVVVTHNRKHFLRLHNAGKDHAGIVICTRDENYVALAHRVDAALRSVSEFEGVLLRVIRPNV